MAGGMKGHRVPKAGADIRPAKDIDEELAQLVDQGATSSTAPTRLRSADSSATVEWWCRTMPAHEADGVTTAS